MNTARLQSGDGSAFTSTTFRHELKVVSALLEREVELSGGFDPGFVAQIAPRSTGVFRFTREESDQLVEIATVLPRIYQRIGAAIQREEVVRSRALAMLQSFERRFWSEFRLEGPWASVLRADVVFDRQGKARILEVNSDNVAGIEAIDILLRIYREVYRLGIDSDCVKALTRLRARTLEFLREHWRRHHPTSVRSPRVAVVYADRDVSMFASNYFAAWLEAAGVSAVARRVEHLEIDRAGAVWTREPLCRSEAVDVVWKDWLATEMYEFRAGIPVASRRQFETILQAMQRRTTLILAPLEDRLLFSKEWLVELCEAADETRAARSQPKLPLDLSKAERRFLLTYLAPSQRLELPSHAGVIKAADSFGGKDVHFLGPGNRKWVTQPRVEVQPLEGYFRRPASGVVQKGRLFSVHGVLMHSPPGRPARLSGVMTRIGPDPVVNWASGAQYLPGLIWGA